MAMTDQEIIEQGKEVVRKEAEAVKNLIEKIDDSFVKAVNAIYHAKGRVIIAGMGKSGLIGKKIVATLTSTGTSAVFLHPAEGIHGDLGILHKDDVVICISKSGDTRELTQIIPLMERLGVTIIAMTGNIRSRLAERSDIILDVSVSEEACLHNLAPTSSTTAALVMGDALAVALLARRNFSAKDFAFSHPGGALGQQLIKIDDIMFVGDRLPIANEQTELKQVISIITEKKFGSACIVNDKEQLAGIITDGDIRRLLEDKNDIWQLKAKEVMMTNPKTIQLGEMAYNAFKILTEFSIMQIVVVDKNNIPKGIVHLHDLIEAGIY